jgi:hypothetical protein
MRNRFVKTQTKPRVSLRPAHGPTPSRPHTGRHAPSHTRATPPQSRNICQGLFFSPGTCLIVSLFVPLPPARKKMILRYLLRRRAARCYMYFQTENRNLGKFWRVLRWKMLVYFMAIWYILWTFGIVYEHLVYFMDIWYILWTFGIFYGHLVYFIDIWYILWTFGRFCGHLACVSPFWYILSWKIWQPCSAVHESRHLLFGSACAW